MSGSWKGQALDSAIHVGDDFVMWDQDVLGLNFNPITLLDINGLDVDERKKELFRKATPASFVGYYTWLAAIIIRRYSIQKGNPKYVRMAGEVQN